MTAADWFLLGLRVAHALAAMVWLGGGVYFLLALRPASRSLVAQQPLVAQAQSIFGEWAQVATLVMIATGVVLMFDRLANDGEGLAYAGILAAKVLAAIIAFWLAGIRPVRRAIRRRGLKRAGPEVIVTLGLFAFVLGVALSSIYGRSAG